MPPKIHQNTFFFFTVKSETRAIFFQQIELSKEHLETVQKQLKTVQTELSQVKMASYN